MLPFSLRYAGEARSLSLFPPARSSLPFPLPTMSTQTFHHEQAPGYCTVDFDQPNGWLVVTWKGFITAQDGERGAQESLRVLALDHAPLLLNDNSQVTGPWFDSVEWLERVWAPQAERLGLRFVAHVMQPDASAGLATAADHNRFTGRFNFQIFSDVKEARRWLHECQQKTA